MSEMIVTFRPLAAGAYVMTLRERRGMKNRADLVSAIFEEFGVKVAAAQIGRIEEGAIDTRGQMWAMLCQVVGGNADDLFDLLANPRLPREAGVERADAWLSAQERDAVKRLADEFGMERVRQALDDLEDDPTMRLFRRRVPA